MLVTVPINLNWIPSMALIDPLSGTENYIFRVFNLKPEEKLDWHFDGKSYKLKSYKLK